MVRPNDKLNSSSLEMAHAFRGRFEIKLDPKGRLSLPQAYRSLLDQRLVVTNSRYRGHSCLHVFTVQQWEKLERRIQKLSSLKPEVQAFSRFYLSGGQPVEIDGQGRVMIPQSLRRFADLDGHAVLVGLGDKIEIWSQRSWSTVFEELSESFEDTLAAVASLDEGDVQ